MVTLCESVGIKQCRVCEEWLDAEDVDGNEMCAECVKCAEYRSLMHDSRRISVMRERSSDERISDAERKYNESAWRIYRESSGRFGWSGHEWHEILKPTNGRSVMWQV